MDVGLRSKIKQQALGLSHKAVERLFADQDRAMRLAELMGKVQRGKKALDQGQQDLLRALQVSPKDDYKAVGKRLASLKRRIRELDGKLGKLR